MKKKDDILITSQLITQETPDEENNRRSFISGVGTLSVAGLGIAALSSTLIPADASAAQSPESIIDNLALLRNVSPSFDGQTYYLLGHTNKGIGGGLWYYDQSDIDSIDDGGLCIKTGGNHILKRLHTPGTVNVEDFGAVGDGVFDSSSAIQAADNAYAEGVVKFGSGSFVFVNINKSITTSWQGVGSGTNEGRVDLGNIDIECTRFIPSQGNGNQVMVNIVSPLNTITGEHLTTYGNGGIKNVRFFGSNNSINNLNAISIRDGARQQYFENIYIRNFADGIEAIGTGEIYLDRVFISQCSNSLRMNNVADSWITNSAFGSGPSFDGVGGRGVLADSCNAIHFTACRLQVSKSVGGLFRNCEDLQFISPIVDQNESHGLVFTNCKRVNISNPDIFDNGTGSSNTAGILIQSSINSDLDGNGVTQGINITGGNIYDQNDQDVGIKQATGIHFSNSGSMTGISIDNVTMENITNKFVNDDQVDGSLRIKNIEGLQLISYDPENDAVITITPAGVNTLIFDTPIMNKITILLPKNGNFEGREVTVSRTEKCISEHKLVARSDAIIQNYLNKKILTPGTTALFKYSESFGDWILI